MRGTWDLGTRGAGRGRGGQGTLQAIWFLSTLLAGGMYSSRGMLAIKQIRFFVFVTGSFVESASY